MPISIPPPSILDCYDIHISCKGDYVRDTFPLQGGAIRAVNRIHFSNMISFKPIKDVRWANNFPDWYIKDSKQKMYTAILEITKSTHKGDTYYDSSFGSNPIYRIKRTEES